MKNNTKQKVILIGLDGATWDLIKPWADEGKLPTFKKLIDNGTWGILKSTVPPLSPSAWVSIYTGCMPSNHGIFGFVKRKKDSYFYYPISGKDIKKPPIWEILSDFGKQSIIINALFAYPPKPIDGIIITGLGTPSLECDFVYPTKYKKIIREKFPQYDVDFNEDLILVSKNPHKFIEKIENVTNEQIKLTKYFIENEKWDFLFSIFRALDVVQHYFWNDKETIYKFYKIFDEFLEYVVEIINKENHILFIVSDHGFGHVKKYFCINNWLEQIGLLKMYKNKNKKTIIKAEYIKKVLLKLGMRNIVWKLKRSQILEKLLKIIPSEELNYINMINWNNTKAYYYEGSDGIININLKDREPQGCVSSEDYEKIVNFIIKELKNIKDPETGEYIVDKVFTKKELFNTENPEIPDIYILLKEGYRAIGYNKIDNSIFMPPIHGMTSRPGDHTIDGIFVAYGNKIQKKLLENVKLWDIAPTILRILQLPIPTWMDGQVITEIFENEDKKLKNFENERKRIREKLKKLVFKKKL